MHNYIKYHITELLPNLAVCWALNFWITLYTQSGNVGDKGNLRSLGFGSLASVSFNTSVASNPALWLSVLSLLTQIVNFYLTCCARLNLRFILGNLLVWLTLKWIFSKIISKLNLPAAFITIYCFRLVTNKT